MGSELPADYRQNLEGFHALNPHWTLRLWGEEDCRSVLTPRIRSLFDAALEVVPADSVWQFRSDIARLAILWKYGGLYADTDFSWQRPIDDLLEAPPSTVVTVWEKEDRFVANGFIYSEKRGHQIFRDCLLDLPGRAHQRRGQRANRITGPSGQWTSFARRRRDVNILPSRHLLPYAWDELHRSSEPFPEAYAIHMWGHQHEIRGLR